MEVIPYNSDDLIKILDKEIPHKCPNVKMTDRDIWIYSGKRELIDFMLRLLEEEQEDK